MKLQNKPGEPIVTREKGAKFYCLACHKEYRKCKCKVYQSADTLGKFKALRAKGKESPYWKGGSPGSRNGNFWHKLRQEVISDQNGCCSNCHKYVGNSLHVHHIKPWSDCKSDTEAHTRTNLIGLCNSCHQMSEPRNQRSKKGVFGSGRGITE